MKRQFFAISVCLVAVLALTLTFASGVRVVARPRLPSSPQLLCLAGVTVVFALGVVSREISLLPRHWDWLSAQPGGASVTLRKLVDAARKASREARRSKDSEDSED